MSNRFDLRRGRLAGVALAMIAVFALPAAAQAAPVGLGTAGPFALATSARSNVFQEFEGGPGQIGIHGTNNLSGAPGSAASHG